MTNPPDDPDQPMRSDADAAPAEDATVRPDDAVAPPDNAAVERLRALLRDEPVDDDELARERRLRVALAAADPVPPARRGAPRRWLVAAAILSVLGIGGYLVAAVGTGSNDTAMVAEDSSGADGESVPRDGDPVERDGDSESTGQALGQDAVPTTVPGMGQESAEAPPGAAVDAPVVDLGPISSVAEAIAAAEALVPGGTGRADTSFRAPAGPVVRCADQQRALGFEVIAVATLDGKDLVVVRSPAGPLVLDAVSCVRREP